MERIKDHIKKRSKKEKIKNVMEIVRINTSALIMMCGALMVVAAISAMEKETVNMTLVVVQMAAGTIVVAAGTVVYRGIKRKEREPSGSAERTTI